MSRISRGLHRLGVVVACAFVLGSATSATTVYMTERAAMARLEARYSAEDKWAEFRIQPKPEQKRNFFDRFDDPEYRTPDYTPALWLLGLAPLSYAFFWSLGWVINGFARREPV